MALARREEYGKKKWRELMTAPLGTPEGRGGDPAAPAGPSAKASSPASASVPNVRIPNCKILGSLGSGPRGEVYRAFDGKRSVALKVLRRGVTVDRPVLERFLKTSTDRI